MLKHVFISYRHESDEHARAVRRLGELLRQAGVPVELDQFYLDENPGGPDEGWPKWCEHRANDSVCVLIIPSQGWFDAYNGTAASGGGHGAASEANLFQQYLYEEKSINRRIRLAFVDSLPPGCSIPRALRGWHQFHPFRSSSELDQLVAWASDRLGLHDVQSPTVRWPDPHSGYQPDLANRHTAEWPAIVKLLSGRSQERILMLQAESGYGKSALLHQAREYAHRLDIPVARLDFKWSFENVPALLGHIDLDLGEHLLDFHQQGADKTHLLRKDLRALRRPVLVILDSYEKATALYTDWVCQNLLPEVEQSLGLAVMIAGHVCPEVDDLRWRGLARRLALGPITDAAHWERWIARRYPDFRDLNVDVLTLVRASGGVPKSFYEMCETIAQGSRRSA